MAIHFTPEEFNNRLDNARQQLQSLQLDALLCFAPETHYYLTGYDTFGFAMFQCLVVPAEGEPWLFTRTPDLRQAQQTSILEDEQILVWKDDGEIDPFKQFAVELSARLPVATRVGVELQTPGLTAANWHSLQRTLGDLQTTDATHLVADLRWLKSPAEIEYIREAARLSDASLDAGLGIIAPGAFEGDVLAAMQGEVFRQGGDYAGNEFVIGSAEGALLCRYHSGRRHLDASDQLTLEWSGACHRYHAAMMRTILIGDVSAEHRDMHKATVEALEACEEAIKPGRVMGDVFDAHAAVFDDMGLSHARLNACGYGMGIAYNPIWVEFPMFYRGNQRVIESGNAFFLHMILMNSSSGLAMCWGHTVLVTDHGVERLTRHSNDLVVV